MAQSKKPKSDASSLKAELICLRAYHYVGLSCIPQAKKALVSIDQAIDDLYLEIGKYGLDPSAESCALNKKRSHLSLQQERFILSQQSQEATFKESLAAIQTQRTRLLTEKREIEAISEKYFRLAHQQKGLVLPIPISKDKADPNSFLPYVFQTADFAAEDAMSYRLTIIDALDALDKREKELNGESRSPYAPIPKAAENAVPSELSDEEIVHLVREDDAKLAGFVNERGGSLLPVLNRYKEQSDQILTLLAELNERLPEIIQLIKIIPVTYQDPLSAIGLYGLEKHNEDLSSARLFKLYEKEKSSLPLPLEVDGFYIAEECNKLYSSIDPEDYAMNLVAKTTLILAISKDLLAAASGDRKEARRL